MVNTDTNHTSVFHTDTAESKNLYLVTDPKIIIVSVGTDATDLSKLPKDLYPNTEPPPTPVSVSVSERVSVSV